MQDTMILGNGTSKQIKTASLPNSYADFKAMAENGNLFADISLNADGCEVVGTPLNKLNLLTDETATKWNANNVDEALSNVFDIVENLPIVLESEIIFEGVTGDFTKSIENFDAISVLSNPTRADASTFSTSNAMVPVKSIMDRIEIYGKAQLYIFTNSDLFLDINKLSVTLVQSSTNIRIYGHKFKVVLNNG